MKAAFLLPVIPGLEPGIPEDSFPRRDPRIKSGDDGDETSGDDVVRAVPRMDGTA
jgi:hypothetical protein